MLKINFVCFGNICRSPMAEYVMKNLVAQAGLSDKISVESSGCHASVGTPISSGTCHELKIHGVPFELRTFRQFTRANYQNCDYIIGMDKMNVRDLKEISGGDPDGKIFLMMDFAGEHRDVADPYMTDNYAATYSDVSRACAELLKRVAQS
ncbi:MAG: low molecular weight phosphotyrosine protein phosphatase [Selenomonadaceae bacterium]|nr:low molecular weight phosphotyrosine protein phosphatase [Selenomonadaceae bacterium]